MQVPTYNQAKGMILRFYCSEYLALRPNLRFKHLNSYLYNVNITPPYHRKTQEIKIISTLVRK